MSNVPDDNVDMYLSSLNEQQLKAYNIAKRHLGTSFDVKRSNGYKDWLKSKK